MLTQIGYVPNIAQSDATLRGLRQLIFYLALCTGNYCYIDDGILLHTQ